MSVTIYHNPRCSKSRKTLEIIADSGTEHEVVLYLEDTPDAAGILDIAEKLGVTVQDILRRGEADFREATDLPALDNDTALAEWLNAHPKVIERPIVVNRETGAAVIGRPPENVEALLD